MPTNNLSTLPTSTSNTSKALAKGGTAAKALAAPTTAVKADSSTTAVHAEFSYPAKATTSKTTWVPKAGTVPGNLVIALNAGPITMVQAMALIAPGAAKVGHQHKVAALCKWLAANRSYGTQYQGGMLSKV
jgi:hypothetical protein